MDLIYRQYAITHYPHVCRRMSCKECPFHIQVTNTLTDCELELFLHNLPSAQSEQQWVSVTDKLPDFGISVLLNEGYSYAVGYLIKTTEGKYEWGINGWYNDLEDWSAWMPLPEPYRKETDERAMG